MQKTFLALGLSLAVGLAMAGDASAFKKKRSDYTKAQQKEFFDYALKQCRKKFGAQLHEVKVNYGKNQYICYHY